MSNLFLNNDSRYQAILAYDQITFGFGIVFIFGLLANAFILYILLVCPSFQNITYKIIRITVISDVISSFTIGYGNINVSAENTVESGTALCRAVLAITFISNGVSMFNLSYIAVDRYFSIVKPFHRFYHSQRQRIFYITSITIWIIVSIYTLIMYPHMQVTQQDPTQCDFPNISTNWEISTKLFVFITMQYLIPCTIIIVTYNKIIKHQSNHVRPGRLTEDTQQADETRKRRFIRMLVFITLCYILCTLPLFATLLGIAITRKSVIQTRNHSFTAFLFLYLSVSISVGIVLVNPIIYLYFDNKIRHKSLEILHGLKNRSIICFNRLK